jgi:hypothetical protein
LTFLDNSSTSGEGIEKSNWFLNGSTTSNMKTDGLKEINPNSNQ